jgi:cobalt-precorrin-5B (C1)-methyltransferase
MKKLKEGFTTGACAAAAAKIAVINLISRNLVKSVNVWFPGDKYFKFTAYSVKKSETFSEASVKKFAGDDPDITNGAIIGAKVYFSNNNGIKIIGGKGVGKVTKRGLAVEVGGPAINPVPRLMIERNIKEVIDKPNLFVEIFVEEGEKLALKTLNRKLGIIGGISILGTTGIVKPVSAEAYRASIDVELNVAIANNINEVVFVTGRTSEKIAKNIFKFPDEAFVTIGDHLGFSLNKAVEKGFKKIFIVGQFGKFTKIASGEFQTHVKYSSIFISNLMSFLSEKEKQDSEFVELIKTSISARLIFEEAVNRNYDDLLKGVTTKVKENCEKYIDKKAEIKCFLVGYKDGVYANSE